MSLAATYNADLARVQLVGTTWGATVTYVIVDRYDTTVLTNPEVVRGGTRVEIGMGDTLRLDDYEFAPGVVNTYRVRAYNASDVEVPTYSYTQTITPALDTVWLKSVIYPFLNRAVQVVDYSDLDRPARGALIPVLGRRDPIAITEVRGPRSYTLTVRARDAQEREALEELFAFGDTVFVHVPYDGTVPESGHFFAGNVSFDRVPKHNSTERYVQIPLTECARPDPAIVGSTATYAGLESAFATYADLAAALTTYLDVLTYVSAPDDETVG